jgi:lipoprotein-anchoring transpeptidase ErfK/SrfK
MRVRLGETNLTRVGRHYRPFRRLSLRLTAPTLRVVFAASTAAAVLVTADCANAQFFNPIFGSPYRSYRYDPYGAQPYGAGPRVSAPPAPYYQRPKRKALDAGKKEPAVKPPPGPLLITISLNKQRLTLYSNGAPIAHAPVSTGTASHPTPTGIFSVIGKERFHRSNLYSNAPMPFMQRITWSGVALHQGVLPGYPASHGCIRLPGNFAQYLFGVTRMGARVIITRDEPTPFEIAHANLFVPKPKASEDPIEPNRPAGQVQARPVKIAESDHPATTTSLNPTQAVVALGERESEGPALKGALDAHTPDIVAPAVATAEGTTAPGTARRMAASAEISEAEPVSTPASGAAAENVNKPGRASTTELKDKPKMSEPVSVFVSRKAGRLYVRQGFEPLFDVPVTIRDADKPLGTHLYTAMEFTADRAAMRWVAVALPTQTLTEPAAPRERKKAAREELARPAAPMSVQLAASSALDRVEMPKEAVDRISDLLSPGSSLIISDYPISGETGKYTDFIILTR